MSIVREMPTAFTPYRPAAIDDRATWTKIAASPACASELKALVAKLDGVPATMPLPTAADYLAARRTNDRGRLDDHWRKVRPQFGQLLTNRLVKGIDPNDADDRLLNWTFAWIGMSTWTVSAHLPSNDLPLSGTGQLDLAGCEAAGELAEMRELALPWIKAQSGTLGESIVREIDRRIIEPVMASDFPIWWANRNAKRTDDKRINNWTGVCAGSILAACLSLEATGVKRDACRDRMLEQLRVFWDIAFGEAGECEEGIGYWSYGVDFACLGMSRMTREQLATSFDLGRVKRVAGYPEACHLIGNLFFAGNDSETTATPTSGITSWLGDLVDSDFLRWWVGGSKVYGLRTVPHIMRYLRWAADGAIAPATRPTTNEAGPRHEPTRLLSDQQAAIFQRPSSRGLLTFTITGGTNGELHNHNDLGTFQLFLGEHAIIPDLGAPQYTTDYFSDKTRYTKYIVAASSGHCCPAINGVEQRTGKEAAAKVLGWSAATGEFSLDLTTAYPPEARLKRWTRSTHVPSDDAIVMMSDEFELDGGGEVVHRIWFADEPKISEGGAMIAVDDVVLHIDPKPAKASVMTIKAGDDRLLLRSYKAEKMLFRVDLSFSVTAGTTLKVETRFETAAG